MIGAWMIYCTVLGVVLLLAGLFADRVVGVAGGQTRRIWAGTLAATLLLPVMALLVQDGAPAFELDGEVVPTSATSGLVMESVETMSTLDAALGWGWLAASFLLAALYAGSHLVTLLQRRRWRADRIDGVDVLVSEDVGPAVVGFLRSRIVLPAWAVDAPVEQRTMIVRHEREHVTAGDPRLLLFAAFATVVVPWNPVAWLMARRLRLAIETDCDRRLLGRGGVDLRGYAELLLAVGARRSRPAYAAGLSMGRPFLEERIDRMTVPASGGRRRAAVLAGFAVALATAVAWDLPQPVRAVKVSSGVPACPIQGAETSRTLLHGIHWST